MAEAKKTTSAAKDKSTTLFDFVINSILVVVFSLFLSIIVEWVGMTYFWEEQGSKHSLDMLSVEIGYINRDFSHENNFGYKPIDLVSYSYETFYGNNEKQGIAQTFINWLNSPSTSETSDVEDYLKIGSNQIKEYLLAAIYITLVFLIRLSVLILTLPLFILVAILGVVDGLAIRDVRRWTSGRESGFRYHYAKSFVLPSFFVAWILYLSIPFSVHPNFIVLPLCLLMGFVVREAVMWFKKYL